MPIDRCTVDQLVVEHLPVAMRLAYRCTGNAHDAEDVVQEALCRVLRRWRSYRGESAFRTWMLQIVVNVDRDRRRKLQAVKTYQRDHTMNLALTVQAPTPHAQVAANEMRDLIRLAIERLPERQREVAILSFGEGLPAREVAQILETTEANVHTCVHLARKRIARSIGADYARDAT